LPFSPFSSPSSTRKHIACSQLRAGMFLIRILDSWWKSPFFVHRRLLRSEDVVQLVRSGIQKVEIDTSKGLDANLAPDPLTLDEPCEGKYEAEAANYQDESYSEEPESCSFDRNNLEWENQKKLRRLRGDAIAALEDVFEGVKTGQVIPLSPLRVSAQQFVQKALAHPTVLAEIMLIEHLEQFDKTLYSHVVDTAVLSILIGLQLGWNLKLLEEVAVAALLHDVGYMRLPLNLVQARWGRTGLDSFLLQQHVDMGLALIQKNLSFPSKLFKWYGSTMSIRMAQGIPICKMKNLCPLRENCWG
jgi:HD-GYP domain-containing protein (c-di-GMP phosphodiesterase class II)